MRRSSRDIEIIEVLTPDDPSLSWDGAAAAPSPPPPLGPAAGRSWRGPTLIAAGVAVLTVAAAVVAVSGGEATPAATPSTSALPSVAPPGPLEPEPGSLGEPLSGFYAVDDVRLTAYGAEDATAQGVGSVFRLWVSGSSTDPWISVEAKEGAAAPTVFPDSERRVVGSYEMVSPLDDPARTTVVIERDTWSATVRANGVDDLVLSRFLDGVLFARGDILDRGAVLDVLGLYSFVHDRSSDDAVFGRSTSLIRYVDLDGRLLTLRVADGAALEEHARVLAFFADGPVEANGWTHVTATLDGTGESVVMWSVDGRLLTLTGGMSIAEVTELRELVQPITGSTFDDLVLNDRDLVGWPFSVPLGEGNATNGAFWTAGLLVEHRAGHTQYRWWWSAPDGAGPAGSAIAPRNMPSFTVQPIVVNGGTYVFIAIPADTDVPGLAVVTDAEGNVLDVPLLPALAGIPMLAGAVLVETPGPIDVSVQAS